MINTETMSEKLQAAAALPNGARFYRCALQVNPFAYQLRHPKPSKRQFETETEYNTAIIAACHQQGVEVIAVTDHYRIRGSMSLLHAAREAGLIAFGGFEAKAKGEVHFLCLFDPDKDDRLERYIGECGVHGDDELSPTGSKDSLELLECAKRWGGICIAAHVLSKGGLLRQLSGGTGINVWRSESLLACAVPGGLTDVEQNYRSILENKNPEYRRDRQIAVINAKDVDGPDDLRDPGATCLIKMSEISIEGLRQAFIAPASRIRLNSDPLPEPHTELVALAWEGGFLDGTAIHFNTDLNVLIGGRGSGKSTAIESLRYVLGLDPLGEETRKAHESMVKDVLRGGTKVSLLIRSHDPTLRGYTIERTVPNPPVVKDEAGKVLDLNPRDIVPDVEVFGQHEIAELAKSPQKRTMLLDRFVEREPTQGDRRSRLRLELDRSRGRIGELSREIAGIDERLATLPALEETLKRFKEAGLEERLKEKSLLVREEALLKTIGERLDPFRELSGELAAGLPLDTAFLSAKALEGLPNVDLLKEMEGILIRLSQELQAIVDQLDAALGAADNDIAAVRERWEVQRQLVEATTEKLLRELQKSKVDGTEFIRLRQQIETLAPLRDRQAALARDLATHRSNRRQLLDEWEGIKTAQFQAIDRAARKVTRKLVNRVRVNVTIADDREPLMQLLRSLGGNLRAALDRLGEREALSLPDLAARCREGREALIEHFALSPGAAERIVQGGDGLFMRIEELDLPATTRIELNIAADGEPTVWQPLERLSKGQKATAVLLLLLLDSRAPLVIDQPEDDLDNRFIMDGVVPTIRQGKGRRQFVFSTHNANIPVLGDAELILGLNASGEADVGRAAIERRHMGAIDSRPVRELVEAILEGGRTAFESRRQRYGY